VTLLGWDAGQILVLYWFENIIIGILTLPRVLSARGGERGGGSNGNGPLGIGCFFVVHYGFFCLGHGIFTLVVLGKISAASPEPLLPQSAQSATGFLWAVIAIAVLHTIIFVRDWIMAGSWRTATPTREMFRPYGRIFVLHITVLLGAWGISELSAPTWTILVLCLAKAVLELAMEWIVRPVTERVEAAAAR
jgi:hypothetical protein